ncbi:hypothetical protein Lal_00029967 [Lupinus albus]|nr:hypothetical protein Lal_00029967 [Lupinus albus]
MYCIIFLRLLFNNIFLGCAVEETFLKTFSGVVQGYTLYPLLFCLAEDVISRGITNLVADRKFKTISGPKALSTTSHVLYAVDVLIFCRGKPRKIHLKGIADRIVLKMAKWKGFSLSIMSEVELVKSIILSMLYQSWKSRLSEKGSPGRVKSWTILEDSRPSESCLAWARNDNFGLITQCNRLHGPCNRLHVDI